MAQADIQADIVVLGAGPGGYPAAFEAADHGKKVVLVSDDVAPGGVCLNRGCIPSKALLHVAKLLNESKEAAHWGIKFAEPEIDLDQLRDYKNKVVTGLTGGIRSLGKSRKVQLEEARGTFLSSQLMELKYKDGSTKTVSFDQAIVATGSVPAMPKMFQIGDDRVMDSTGALELKDIPGKLLVIGGGYIGLEMGSVYASLGSEVTVVEMLDGLLPGADRDLVKPLQKKLEKSLHAIFLKTKVLGLEATTEGILAKLEGDSAPAEALFDRVLISIGRRPNAQNIGLDKTKVEIDDKGFIKVNRKMQTADPAIYAIGDVAGEPMLAHKATREAKVAVDVILGQPAEFDAQAIPAVVFTDPEIAWCGYSEAQAKEKGLDVTVVKFPWAASGRAQSIDRTEGLTKLIFENKTERILGMGIVGPGAGEMIAEGVLAVETAATARDLAESIHAHPTLSETIMESAEGMFGQATHYFRPKK